MNGVRKFCDSLEGGNKKSATSMSGTLDRLDVVINFYT